MALSIPITGLAANDPVPGAYIDLQFAVGPASSGSTTYPILLIGNKLAAGTATPDTVIYGPDTATTLASLTDAQNLFGLGSELYRMYKRAIGINPITPIYAIAVTASGGVQATLTATLATTATANGTLRVFVMDEFVDTAITSGDTAITIATNACANINAKIDWPVTASNGGTATITLTARTAGLRGNWLRAGSQIIGTGVGTTTSLAPMSFFTGGTVADSYTTALSTILAKRYYYIVSADDGGQASTNLTSLLTQVGSQALPTTGIRQTVFSGCVDTTAANANTIAIALNTARAQLIYLPGGDIPPAEMASLVAAAKAYVEANFSSASLNFDSYGNTTQSQALWRIPAPRGGQALTRTQIVSALNNGVSPIAVTSRGQAYLVSLITTKSQTSSQPDYRIRDAHKVSICDRYADDLQNKITLQFAGKTIGNDPQPGQRPPGPNVVTPRVFKALIQKLTNDYNDNDLLQNVAAILAGTITNRESSPTTRLTASIPLQPTDVLHQTGVQLLQVA